MYQTEPTRGALRWEGVEELHGMGCAPVLVEGPESRIRSLTLSRLAGEVAEAGGRILWIGSQQMASPLAWLSLRELRLEARGDTPPVGPAPWPRIQPGPRVGSQDDEETLASTREWDIIVVSGHPIDVARRNEEVVRLIELFATEAIEEPEVPALLVVEDWLGGLDADSHRRVLSHLVDLGTIVPRSCLVALASPPPERLLSVSVRASSSGDASGSQEDALSDSEAVVTMWSPSGAARDFALPPPACDPRQMERAVL